MLTRKLHRLVEHRPGQPLDMDPEPVPVSNACSMQRRAERRNGNTLFRPEARGQHATTYAFANSTNSVSQLVADVEIPALADVQLGPARTGPSGVVPCHLALCKDLSELRLASADERRQIARRLDLALRSEFGHAAHCAAPARAVSHASITARAARMLGSVAVTTSWVAPASAAR